jgi:phasin family protein
MVQATEQVAAFSKSQLDAVLKLAEAAAENLEKLTDVQLKAAKAGFDEGVRTLKQLAAVKDVNELASVTAAAAHPAWDKGAAYAKSVYEVLVSAQAEFASLLEEQVAEFNKNTVVTLDAALKSAPAGSESAIAALKSAIQSANTVYETMLKAAKQLASVTEANVAAVAQAAPARKKAA